MQTHINTPTANPATVLRALLTLDGDAQDMIAHVITRASQKVKWLNTELLDAIKRQQEAEEDEDRWLEREELRDRYYRGLY